MKSHKPSRPHLRRDRAVRSSESEDSGRATVLDYCQGRIEAFNRQQGGGVTVRKGQNGYTLMREDTQQPIARLRPLGGKGSFAILYWSQTSGRWARSARSAVWSFRSMMPWNSLPKIRLTVSGPEPAINQARIRSRSSQNSGYVLATQPGSSIVTPAMRVPASANDIAMR